MVNDRHVPTVEDLIRPALDAYSAEISRHNPTSYSSPDCSCTCGWTPPATVKRPRISLGMHIKAAHHAADAAYAAHTAELLRERTALIRGRSTR